MLSGSDQGKKLGERKTRARTLGENTSGRGLICWLSLLCGVIMAYSIFFLYCSAFFKYPTMNAQKEERSYLVSSGG